MGRGRAIRVERMDPEALRGTWSLLCTAAAGMQVQEEEAVEKAN